MFFNVFSSTNKDQQKSLDELEQIMHKSAGKKKDANIERVVH